MKVNNVYAEEIAKWDGVKATKPFSVLWDDPESGADLKVVYRTPRLVGSIMLVIGLAAIAGAAFIGWLSLHDATVDVLPGCCVILVFGLCVAIGALRTGFTRMEYEFKRGVCAVRYSLAGLLRRQWTFAYDDKTRVFAGRILTTFTERSVPDYGFLGGDGSVLFRTRQAMNLDYFNYFSLIVIAYFACNEDEEASKSAIINMRMERNIYDKSELKRLWIFMAVLFSILAASYFIQSHNRKVKRAHSVEKEVFMVFCSGGDYKAKAVEQKAQCEIQSQKRIDDLVALCDEYDTFEQQVVDALKIEDVNVRIKALEEFFVESRTRYKRLQLSKGALCRFEHYFASKYQMLEQVVRRVIDVTIKEPTAKVVIKISEKSTPNFD